MLRNAIVLFRTVTVLAFAVGHEGLHVHGPSCPVVAQLGGSVLLPCFVESPLPLEGLQVEWRKTDSNSLVGLFQQGKSRPDLQSQGFRGRVDFFPHEITKGNFSILLKNVVEEDTGGYRCKVNTAQESSEVIMEVSNISGLVVTGADQNIFASKGEDVILNCSVDSRVPASEIEEVTWKKTNRDPEILVLLYQDNKIFPDSSHESYHGRVDLFSSEIPNGNFSLKLMDVKMEDKGEFTCEVHTRNMSGRTTVVLQGVGFAALHIAILVLCSVALLIAVGFCGPVCILLRKKVASKEGMKRHIFLILCPNICMFLSFCLWSSEGFLAEIITCSTVSIMRPVILLKTSSYLGRLPQCLQKTVKALAVPFYHSAISLAGFSIFFENYKIRELPLTVAFIIVIVVTVISSKILAIYSFQIYLTMCLEIFNGTLLGFIMNTTKVLNFSTEVISPPLMGMMVALVLQSHFFQGEPFTRVHLALSSAIVMISSLSFICLYIFLAIMITDYASMGWVLLFEAIMYIVIWIGVIYLLRRQRGRNQGFSSQWRKIGYLCCTVIVAFLIVAVIAITFHYLKHYMDETDVSDRSGYFALIPLIHVLIATCLFKHPKYLPDFLHMMIYMFGAVVLSTVSAFALATELILKAGKGARSIGDLRVIVLPLETVFCSAWLMLQIYDSWMKFKERHFKEESRAEPEIQEMEEMNPNLE
ncbi:uncharacterized protein LOC113655246 isoform X2 [Tachysurus fulvidraco]|uniref:uncharacterized protein LOC113655246 isoform X2 n=1 Tax=Tachysurus fulvidraco TaxID=1234273 RepID=UPI001FEFCD8B|nr:uncharacterized protein LOC113655246 isoform X2 [Tachysurus fulvidraco]